MNGNIASVEQSSSDSDADNDSDTASETPVAAMQREIEELKDMNEVLKSQLGNLQKGIENMGEQFLEKLGKIQKELREERSEKVQMKKALSEAMNIDTNGIQKDHSNDEKKNDQIDNAFSQRCEGGGGKK